MNIITPELLQKCPQIEHVISHRYRIRMPGRVEKLFLQAMNEENTKWEIFIFYFGVSQMLRACITIEHIQGVYKALTDLDLKFDI